MLVVGPIPPPVHGAARVTDLVLAGLRAAGADVVLRDTSGADDAPRPLFHLDRTGIHLAICWSLVRYRRTARFCRSSGYFFGAAIETPFPATRPQSSVSELAGEPHPATLRRSAAAGKQRGGQARHDAEPGLSDGV